MYPPKTEADRLEALVVRGLTYEHPGNGVSGGGIKGIDLELQRGELVVITGRVASGKSTLARALIGLLPKDAGEVYWNGELVRDLSGFFRPPRCAYLPQTPRLFSDSLRNNILMGIAEGDADLPDVIHLSILEQDIETLERGLDTLVGPRGVRLSGGQVQRAAAARMFVRAPELLVIDDLSSALDVETEQALWERIDERRAARHGPYTLTCLVVSHRRAALTRADRILLLKNGKLEAQGRLEELLTSSEEMQKIWKGA